MVVAVVPIVPDVLVVLIVEMLYHCFGISVGIVLLDEASDFDFGVLSLGSGS